MNCHICNTDNTKQGCKHYSLLNTTTKHTELINILRNVSKEPYFKDKSVLIPEGCQYIKEGEYLIKDLLHFIADMME
jgi:hypothetical protein